MQDCPVGGSTLLLLEMPCSRAEQGQLEDAHLDNEDRPRNKWNDNTPQVCCRAKKAQLWVAG